MNVLANGFARVSVCFDWQILVFLSSVFVLERFFFVSSRFLKYKNLRYYIFFRANAEAKLKTFLNSNF